LSWKNVVDAVPIQLAVATAIATASASASAVPQQHIRMRISAPRRLRWRFLHFYCGSGQAATVSGDMLRQLHLHLHPQPRSRLFVCEYPQHPHIRIVASAVILHNITSSESLFYGDPGEIWQFFRLLFLLLGTCAQTFKSIVFQSPEGIAAGGGGGSSVWQQLLCKIRARSANQQRELSEDAEHFFEFLGGGGSRFPGILESWYPGILLG